MPQRSEQNISSMSQWIRVNAGRIVRNWEARIRREVGAAKLQEGEALRNRTSKFVEYLARLIDAAVEGDGALGEERRSIHESAARHGMERSDLQPYVLGEVIMEYHILREVIFEIAEEFRELRPKERDAIISAIEEAVNDSASQFLKSIQSRQNLFVHTLVHDLRGPLNNITMGTEILEGPGEEESAGSASNVRHIVTTNLRRLDEMITQLLDAGRARAGGILDLEFAPLDLAELVSEVLEDRRFKRVRLLPFAGNPIIGKWNREGLRRIVENLLDNALKYGDPRLPVTITVRSTEGEAMLSVHNEGKPIPEALRSSLFQEFRRAIDLKQKGWGLGLSLVKGMVEAHRGNIEIECEKGQGTTFTVWLPR